MGSQDDKSWDFRDCPCVKDGPFDLGQPFTLTLDPGISTETVDNFGIALTLDPENLDR